MINSEKLNSILNAYKEHFPPHWNNEKYKWEAVAHFQKHWNIDAENFGEMFKAATDKTYNLLASGYNYPRVMIIDFAAADDSAVRDMFRSLFDESVDLAERIGAFQTAAEELRLKYDDGTWHQHYQNINSISTYLWLRYPDKYYIYKYEIVRSVAVELEADFRPKKNGKISNLTGAYGMYDEICSEIKSDSEMYDLLKGFLTSDCYPDPEMKTVTIDTAFYAARLYKDPNKKQEEWIPNDYSPELSVDDWTALLRDSSVFNESSLEIMKRMKDYGGQATCKQLSVKYGNTVNFYNAGSSALAKRVAEKTGCRLSARENGKTRWWAVLYLGRNAEKEDEGSFTWRLRDELSEAIDRIDLSKTALYEKQEDGKEPRGYWWLTASPKIWSYSDLDIDAEQSYTLYNDNGHKRRIFQNFLDVKPGDPIIGYEANPVKKVVALGCITQANDGKIISFKKTEGLTSPIDYSVLKDSPELQNMEFFVQPNGSLFKLTKGEYEFIMDIIREENPLRQSHEAAERYTKEDFLGEVYMTSERYDLLEALLRNKKNVILQGAPGVGKTFTAKRLAYSMMGEKDDSRIETVQFHQSYSYEDFIMGYRPDGAEFKLTDGIFCRFCQKAANDPDNEYFFIIDEINRGNMSKIFGELLMLIEKDYRGTKTTLAYSGRPFSVPENLYIIGMMNTADRSLAMIDYALRRRFSFFEIEPGFNSDAFREYQKGFANETFDTLIEQIKLLNKDIANDDSLGQGFCIGHSYFCGRNEKGVSEEWMRSVVEFDIIPMLAEYWFDDKQKRRIWEGNLRGVFDD